jgi:hypothetical protein
VNQAADGLDFVDSAGTPKTTGVAASTIPKLQRVTTRVEKVRSGVKWGELIQFCKDVGGENTFKLLKHTGSMWDRYVSFNIYRIVNIVL